MISQVGGVKVSASKVGKGAVVTESDDRQSLENGHVRMSETQAATTITFEHERFTKDNISHISQRQAVERTES